MRLCDIFSGQLMSVNHDVSGGAFAFTRLCSDFRQYSGFERTTEEETIELMSSTLNSSTSQAF